MATPSLVLGDRSKVANKDLSDIFHFIGGAPVMKSLDYGCNYFKFFILNLVISIA